MTLCATRPADWWDLGDGGNRLALMLCSVCPERVWCSTGDPDPHGVIRGGVAYSNDGARLPLCPCGRPAANTERKDCFTCEPRWDTRIPRYVRRKRHRRGAADAQAERIAALRAGGLTYREISEELDIPYSTLRGVVGRCPQAVSTVVDG